MPRQIDVRRQLRARHFNTTCQKIRIKISTFRQTSRDPRLRAFVNFLVKNVTNLREECINFLLEVHVIAAFAFDLDIRLANTHGITLVHDDRQLGDIGLAAALHGHLRGVIPKRFQRLSRLRFDLIQQVLEATFGDVLVQ